MTKTLTQRLLNDLQIEDLAHLTLPNDVCCYCDKLIDEKAEGGICYPRVRAMAAQLQISVTWVVKKAMRN